MGRLCRRGKDFFFIVEKLLKDFKVGDDLIWCCFFEED